MNLGWTFTLWASLFVPHTTWSFVPHGFSLNFTSTCPGAQAWFIMAARSRGLTLVPAIISNHTACQRENVNILRGLVGKKLSCDELSVLFSTEKVSNFFWSHSNRCDRVNQAQSLYNIRKFIAGGSMLRDHQKVTQHWEQRCTWKWLYYVCVWSASVCKHMTLWHKLI